MEILIFLWLGCAIGATIVAISKGRSGCGWLILSIIFGPIALLGIATASKDQDAAKKREVKAGFQDGKLRKCPYCVEVILGEASRCKHCGKDVDPIPPPKGFFARTFGK